MEGRLGRVPSQVLMQLLEDLIDGSVMAPSIPPALDHSSVIPIYCEIPSLHLGFQEVSDQAFKSDGLSPADVPLPSKRLPSRYEPPGSPLGPNGNGDSKLGTCIRKSLGIIEGNRAKDCPIDGWLSHSVDPPV